MVETYVVTMTQFTNFMLSLLALFIVAVILWATYDWKESVEEMKQGKTYHPYKKKKKH